MGEIGRRKGEGREGGRVVVVVLVVEAAGGGGGEGVGGCGWVGGWVRQMKGSARQIN